MLLKNQFFGSNFTLKTSNLVFPCFLQKLYSEKKKSEKGKIFESKLPRSFRFWFIFFKTGTFWTKKFKRATSWANFSNPVKFPIENLRTCQIIMFWGNVFLQKIIFFWFQTVKTSKLAFLRYLEKHVSEKAYLKKIIFWT